MMMDKGILLISLAAGYTVLSNATANSNKPVKLLGIITGIVILTVSAFDLMTGSMCGSPYSKHGYSKSMGMMMGKCPMPGHNQESGDASSGSGHMGMMGGFKHPPIPGMDNSDEKVETK